MLEFTSLSASVPNKYRKTIKQHKIFNVTNHKNTFHEEMVKSTGKMRILYISRGSWITTSGSYTATHIENFSNISGCNQSVTFEQCHIIIHIMVDFLRKKREELGTKEGGKLIYF